MTKYLIFIVIAVLVVWVASVLKPSVVGTANTNTNQTVVNSVQTTMPAGLKIEDLVVGTGAEAKSGDLVTVNYVGTLENGTKFDASADHGTDGFTFPLGQGQVIKGWDLGVVGMKVGGKRKLTIPPELGYGAAGAGGGKIPPNATLIFEVELLAVRSS